MFRKILLTSINKSIVIIRKCSSRGNSVRVRFAPSPTGYLHLGGLRTALYNYAFAKSLGGKLVLRIEDTDQSRLVPGSIEKIKFDLEWCGLIPDEGPEIGGNHGPYIQSQRKDLYKNEVEKLIKNGAAYYCFCSKRRLDLLRQNAIRNQEVPKYDNHCRNLSQEELQMKLSQLKGSSPCVRFKLGSSEQFKDLVFGEILHEVEEIEGDPIIFKSDGFPTYHLANVVDDHHMGITHVIRGVEWLQSTNKHLMIYRAFGYEPPLFAHLPLLLNSDGSKLSKRHGDFSVEHFREIGIYPRALLNFITKAGGGFQTDAIETSYSLPELVGKFHLLMLNANSCKLPLHRLPEFNRAEIQRKVRSKSEIRCLVQEIKQILTKNFPDRNIAETLDLSDFHIEKILRWSSTRINYLNDLLGPNLLFLWLKPSGNDLVGVDPEILQILNKKLLSLKFDKVHISSSLKELCEEQNISFKELMIFLRKSLSGFKDGPGVAEMMEILGKETSINRIESAISILNKKEQQ